MSKIYFVRHGQSEWNVQSLVCGATNSPLTAQGVAQAQETARVIKERIDSGEIHIDEIIASPLSRAYNTGKAISDATGIPIRIDPRIVEQNFGEWEGRNKDTAEFQFAKVQFADGHKGGESNMRVAQRVYNLLDELKEDQEHTYLLAAHNAVARVVNSYFKDMTNEDYATFQLDNAQVLEYEF